MTKAQRATLQPHLDALGLKAGKHYSWNEGNALRLHCRETAEGIAKKLARRGVVVDLQWNPEFIHWTMPNCHVYVGFQ